MENAEKLVRPFNPDLCIVAFGANDTNTPCETVISNLKNIINQIKSYNDDCEFILIAEAIPNKLLSSDKCRFYGNQPSFEKPIIKLQQQGSAVASVTDLQTKLYTRKRFIDLTGNNVNHPNDFFHRLHAQYILSVFD